MKKSLLIGVAILSLAALLTLGAWAWFTASAEPVSNTFTAGTVEIEINEHGFEGITDWNPGDTTEKKVSVKNTGSKCAYVRVSLTPVWGTEDGEGVFTADEGLDIDNIVLNLDKTKWVYIEPADPPSQAVPGEGWYYYKHILCPEAGETELLLKSVTLKGSATDNSYQGKTLQIVVGAEAVQASHEAYKDAWSLDELPAGVEVWTESQ